MRVRRNLKQATKKPFLCKVMGTTKWWKGCRARISTVSELPCQDGRVVKSNSMHWEYK
ncbi:MAG: hypothetical protein SO434_03690 [Eubacteriales bacterium]|nr:hypothetical protein [Eubacteriales bacterium]